MPPRALKQNKTPPLASPRCDRRPGAHVSRHARAVLSRLAKGLKAKPLGDGSFRLGSQGIAAALARELRARDLVRVNMAGYLEITTPGEAILRRYQPRGDRACGPAGMADDFAAQHQERRRRRIMDDGRAYTVTANLAESPLYWLRRRKDRQGRPLISETQFEAGEKLRAAYETAMRPPAMTMRWDAPPISRTPRSAPLAVTAGEAQLMAKRRLDAALKAVGPGLGDILIKICCHHQGLEVAERALGWPQRSAKVVLAIALERLAAHYGME